jgi:hypothetical protein
MPAMRRRDWVAKNIRKYGNGKSHKSRKQQYKRSRRDDYLDHGLFFQDREQVDEYFKEDY